jgi:hypothetical protein
MPLDTMIVDGIGCLRSPDGIGFFACTTGYCLLGWICSPIASGALACFDVLRALRWSRSA